MRFSKIDASFGDGTGEEARMERRESRGHEGGKREEANGAYLSSVISKETRGESSLLPCLAGPTRQMEILASFPVPNFLGH
jgi:hypothetical protein